MLLCPGCKYITVLVVIRFKESCYSIRGFSSLSIHISNTSISSAHQITLFNQLNSTIAVLNIYSNMFPVCFCPKDSPGGGGV